MKMRRKNTLLAAVLVPLIAASGSAFAASADGNFIGEAEARAIALGHAGIGEANATFVQTFLDRDDGRFVYDVEFYSGNIEYDYEIDATSGTIVEFDRDIENYFIPGGAPRGSGTEGQSRQQPPSSSAGTYGYIGEAAALAIALANAGLAEGQAARVRVHLDHDDGQPVYEIDFHSGRTEYEYEIDAVSGRILESGMDTD
jgi:uncharacterized membrane protein YkoI